MGQKQLWTDETLTALGEELVACVSEVGVWHISEFTERKEKSPGWLYAIIKAYPEIMTKYHSRCKHILGRKMLKQSMEKSPDRWVIKTFMPRMLDAQDEVNEALETEELIKAQAKIRALKKELHHKGEILDYINAQKQLEHITS